MPMPMQGGMAGKPPGINFDRFVRCCVAVRQLTEGESLSLSV